MTDIRKAELEAARRAKAAGNATADHLRLLAEPDDDVQAEVPEPDPDNQGQVPARTAMGGATADTDRQRAKWQYDTFPRWLRHSGLPQVLGPSCWMVFEYLVVIDDQRHALRPYQVPTSAQGDFVLTHGQIADGTGLSKWTVRRNLRNLAPSKLLSHYEVGPGGRGGLKRSSSRFGIDREVIVELFLYAGPRTATLLGGISGLDSTDKDIQAGVVIYGDRRDGVVVTWQTIKPHLRPSKAPAQLDLDKVAEIIGFVRIGKGARFGPDGK